MIVFDVTNMDSFISVRDWLQEVRHHSADEAQVILIANKTDLVAKRVVSKESGAALAEELRVPYIETSAKTATNVEEAFHLAVRTFIREV